MIFAAVKVGGGPGTPDRIVQGETAEDVVEQIKLLTADRFCFFDEVDLKSLSVREFVISVMNSFARKGGGRLSPPDSEWNDFTCHDFLRSMEQMRVLKFIEGEYHPGQ